ncbi:MAG: hypothetical protein KatS3mg027_1669 [Bacteroidia bacterium]|nr:MAG: hypothetical protein KatS3mg027_1669 [Bacteroidia bacterium]
MKKLSIFIYLLTIGVFLTSCSTQNFLKRKYTKGMFIETIAHSKKPQSNYITNDNQTSYPLISKHLHNNPIELSSTSPNNQENIISQNNISETKTYSKKQILLSNKHQLQNNKRTSLSSSNHSYTPNSYHSFKPQQKNITAFTISQKKDDDKIIWVILSLIPILCLIAIYLHDGKKVTTNFWIDLILHLLLVLPAIIFALLVVLDVINLA